MGEIIQFKQNCGDAGVIIIERPIAVERSKKKSISPHNLAYEAALKPILGQQRKATLSDINLFLRAMKLYVYKTNI